MKERGPDARRTRSTRRVLLSAAVFIIVSLAAAVPGGAVGVSSANAATKPDVIVVMVDDLGAIDDRVLQRLPNIRSLWLDHGLRFDDAYAETPLCCPGRASFLTGQHTKHHGVTRNDGRLLNPQFTIATNLHSHGYYTIDVGRYLNRTNSIHDKTPPGWDRTAMLLNWDGNRTSNWTVQGVPRKARYMDRFTADQSVYWLSHAPPHRPVFMWITPFAPHLSKDPALMPWGNDIEPRYENDPRCNGIPPWRPPTYRNIDRPNGFPLEGICRSLLTVDDMIGQLRSTVAAEGRDPIWIFTSDNGMSWGRDGFRGKDVPESDRLPLYFAGPGIRSGVTTALVSNIDLGPTIAAMAGTHMPRADGASYLPVVFGDREKFRSWLLEDHPQSIAGPWWGIRTPVWHFIEWPGVRGEELFRTTTDRWEQTNLAAERPARVQLLKDSFLSDPIIWHGPSPTPTPSASPTEGDPNDDAAFVSQDLPSNMLVGQPYDVSVTFQNTGSTVWSVDAGYAIGLQDPQGSDAWGSDRVPLPQDVEPGEQVTVDFTLTAPAKPWFYYLQVQLVDSNGTWFGEQSAQTLVDVDEVYGPPQGPQGGGG